MARKDIHPKIQTVSYIMLDGSIAPIASCYSKSEKMILEVDIFNHAAWRSDKQYINENVGNVAKFRQKFNMSADTLSNIVKKSEAE
jgi:ribosomal protein L31